MAKKTTGSERADASKTSTSKTSAAKTSAAKSGITKTVKAATGRTATGMLPSNAQAGGMPTATEIVAALAQGKTTAVDVIEGYLARIAEREKVVQAFAVVDAAGARALAKQADARRKTSSKLEPLHGVPVAFKDIVNTAGMATEYNSPIYKGHVPTVDASVVALSRVAGGIVLGKTVTCEFANRAPGPTTNPHNAAHTPGGSSQGSAAAVAAGFVPLAIGTQTSGSVIRPASYCGVHGFKGSWGEISYAGVKLTSATLDTIGLYARSLPDIALFQAVLTGQAPTNLLASNVGGLRVGLHRGPFYDQAKPETEAALAATAKALEKAGATVTDFDLPAHFTGLNDAVRWISAWEGARSLAWEKSFHRDRISPELRDGRINDGEVCSPDLYRDRCRLAEICRIEFEDFFDDIDVLLTPAAPGEAPVGLKETGTAVFNMMWTALHTPCVTLPGHVGPKGLPVGVQLVGKRGCDRQLLEIASWVEKVALR
ncbi:MAG TPA: amidase [Stellaceae bacterium]|nr:amidase [Stellaceae bacterium]